MTRSISNPKYLLFPVLCALLLSTIAPIAMTQTSAIAVDWIEHDRIGIDGDAQFTAANGVVSGSGTKSDPYIIEGWKIGPSEHLTGIDIRNTGAYFKVKNVYVFSCGIGVLLTKVHNGRVESSQFINDSVGIAVVESDDCKIVSNTFEGNDLAISIVYSDVSRSDNTYINNGQNVVRLKHEQQWELTWVGAAVCVAVFIPLFILISLLVYYRYRHWESQKPKP